MTTTGDRLKYFIDEHLGLQVKEAALLIGIDKNMLSSYCSGARNLGRESLDKLAAAFPQLSIDWLLYGRGHMLTLETVPTGLDPFSFTLANYLKKDQKTRIAAIKFLSEISSETPVK
ncbi:helix-turn-helix domain-containing protein [Flavobacterium sp. RHBU_3]|uniref:helix-turn-helix domain-containing protein n=1 Tax=Flavobacterium sp. RHBU_3 TaxID=3391184 RepID=UPI0039854929